MMSLSMVLLVSIVSGLYTSLWGAFKDGPWEGFHAKTFPRSIFFSIGIAIFLYYGPSPVATQLRTLPLFHVFLVVMGFERMVTEVYKACFRNGDQAIFFIPQQMTIFGKNVENEAIRMGTGIVLFIAIFSIPLIERTISSLPLFIITGFLTGMFICSGGAYKDAPFEGFDPRKFFRSAIVLAAVSPLIYLLGPIKLGFLIYSFGGLERLLVEYYKSYVVHSVPGKFRPDLDRIEGRFTKNRHYLHYTAISIVLFLVYLYVLARLDAVSR